MAEVKMGTLYRVDITEHEYGAESSTIDTQYFSTLVEAEDYRANCRANWENDGHPASFWRAAITKVA